MATNYNYIDGLERIDLRLQADVDPNRIPTIPRHEECGTSGTTLCYGTVVSVRFGFPEHEEAVDEFLKIKTIECFVSEACEIFGSNVSCRDVLVSGDEITAIYNTALKTEVNEVIDDLARVRTLVAIIEKKAHLKRGVLKLRLSACYSTINLSVVETSAHAKRFLWRGEAMTKSRLMLDKAFNGSILISKVVWNNLSESNQKLFTPHDLFSENYEGNIVNVAMNNWLDSK